MDVLHLVHKYEISGIRDQIYELLKKGKLFPLVFREKFDADSESGFETACTFMQRAFEDDYSEEMKDFFIKRFTTSRFPVASVTRIT